jgi:hypothetical protein
VHFLVVLDGLYALSPRGPHIGEEIFPTCDSILRLFGEVIVF